MGNHLKTSEAILALKAGLDQIKIGTKLLEDILLGHDMEIETLRNDFYSEKERNKKLKTEILKILEEDLNEY